MRDVACTALAKLGTYRGEAALFRHGEIAQTPLAEVAARRKQPDLSLFELARVLAC